MSDWTRRDLLKSGAVLSVGVAGALKGGKPLSAAEADASAVDAEAQAHPLPQSDTTAAGSSRERLLLDFGWRFRFGHASDATKDLGFGRSGTFAKTGNFISAGRAGYDDRDWRPVDLPHDWAVELPFQNDSALSSRGFYPLGRTYPETSIGWYRRVFEIPEADAGKRISFEFDGVYRDATVIFNNFYLGSNASGYAPFRFDVTDFAKPGARNVLLLRVDATLSDGWFYEGAGIYRHVWLVKTSPVHVRQWGTFVRSEVDARRGQATLSIRTEVDNRGQGAQSTRVTSTILDPSGKAVGKASTAPVSIPEWEGHTYEQQVVVKQPALWSLEERNLYKLVTEVEAGGASADRYETTFGIRSVRFDAEKGLFINGKSVKVKGTCNHQDHAGLGTALPDAVQLYRIRTLKEMGSNAYRTSHNHPTPELLDACDQLGMLVFDETRMMSSNPEGLSQFERLVRRDRNHPSVFMWSMGNEEREAPTEQGLRILTAMKRVATVHDGSRPVSTAPLGGNNMGKGGFAVCDVQGYNYADPAAEKYHQSHPQVPVIGTETVSAVGTRGIYLLDPEHGYVGSYDPWTTTGRASAEGWWSFCNARPWLAGGFVWTGFDYRGEPSPYSWPNISSQYGIIDTCGFPKDTFFYYQSWWTSQPVLHVFPHWNWERMEGKDIIVCVYSNLEKVELLLNGKSLGTQEMQRDRHLAWRVAYTPGTIEARGFRGGEQILTAKRETTGPAAKLAVRADREEIAADGEDIAMFAVEVQDAQGRAVPRAEDEVTFQVSGPAKLIGVGNGNPTSHEPDKANKRQAFGGLCMGIVQSSKQAGSVHVEVTSPGLTPASAVISTKDVKLRPSIPIWVREVPVGPGVTGVWRPAAGSDDSLFTFKQSGSMLTGIVEEARGSSEQTSTIEDGKANGNNISFKAGNTAYTGTLTGDQLRIERESGGTPGASLTPGPTGAIQPAGAGAGTPPPAVGPPPDGSDPSSRGWVAAQTGKEKKPQPLAPLMLRRIQK